MATDKDVNAFNESQMNDLASVGIAHKRKHRYLETGRFASEFTQSIGLWTLPAVVIPALFNPSILAQPIVKVVAVSALAAVTTTPYLMRKVFNDKSIDAHRTASIDICGFMNTARWTGNISGSSHFWSSNCTKWPQMSRPDEQVNWRDVDWLATMACEDVVFTDDTCCK